MKLLLIFLIFFLSLNAKENINYYKKGLIAYKNKQYKKAIEYFKKSISHYSDIKMQILWAKAEEKRGRLLYAIAAYERAYELDPKNYVVALNLIRLYKKNNQYQLAQDIINNFDKRDLTPSQRNALLELLGSKSSSLNKITARIGINTGYDSNVASLASATVKKRIKI